MRREKQVLKWIGARCFRTFAVAMDPNTRDGPIQINQKRKKKRISQKRSREIAENRKTRISREQWRVKRGKNEYDTTKGRWFGVRRWEKAGEVALRGSILGKVGATYLGTERFGMSRAPPRPGLESLSHTYALRRSTAMLPQ